MCHRLYQGLCAQFQEELKAKFYEVRFNYPPPPSLSALISRTHRMTERAGFKYPMHKNKRQSQSNAHININTELSEHRKQPAQNTGHNFSNLAAALAPNCSP